MLQQKSADFFLNIQKILIYYKKHSEVSQTNRVAAKIFGIFFEDIEKIHIYYIEHSEASQTNRVAAKIRARKCAADMYFISDSWIPEILRFTLASPDIQRFFRLSKRVQNGPVWLKGQNFTGLTCTRGLR